MPEKIERELKRLAAKKGLKGKKKSAYVYGTMNKFKKINDPGQNTGGTFGRQERMKRNDVVVPGSYS